MGKVKQEAHENWELLPCKEASCPMQNSSFLPFTELSEMSVLLPHTGGNGASIPQEGAVPIFCCRADCLSQQRAPCCMREAAAEPARSAAPTEWGSCLPRGNPGLFYKAAASAEEYTHRSPKRATPRTEKKHICYKMSAGFGYPVSDSCEVGFM